MEGVLAQATIASSRCVHNPLIHPSVRHDRVPVLSNDARGSRTCSRARAQVLNSTVLTRMLVLWINFGLTCGVDVGIQIPLRATEHQTIDEISKAVLFLSLAFLRRKGWNGGVLHVERGRQILTSDPAE